MNNVDIVYNILADFPGGADIQVITDESGLTKQQVRDALKGLMARKRVIKFMHKETYFYRLPDLLKDQ